MRFEQKNLKVLIVNIIITFSLIILSLYIFEFYLLSKKQNQNLHSFRASQLENKEDLKNDSRTILQVYNSLKDTEDVTVKFFPYGSVGEQSDIFPLSGISNKKTIFCNENGYMSFYKSDRYGFNNPDQEWQFLENNNREAEYVLLGDSFTHGACVNRPNDIASVLRLLTKKVVINLGYIGNGPLIEYATYREYVSFNSKNVLLLFFEQGDLEQLFFELKNPILNSYIQDINYSQNLKKKIKNVDDYVKERIDWGYKGQENLIFHQSKFKKKKYKILKFIRLDKTKNFFKSKISYFIKREQVPFEEFKLIIKRLDQSVKSKSGNFYFVYLPGPQRYLKKSYLYEKKINKNKKKIFEYLKNENIKIIDIYDQIFLNNDNPLSLFSKAKDHYNEKGYKIVAETIYQNIKVFEESTK